MRAQGIVQTGRLDLCGQFCRAFMAAATGLVLGIIVIPAIGDDIRHPQRPVAHHRRRQLAARSVSFDHHLFRHRRRQPWRIGPFADDIDSDRRAFVVGLHDIGRGQDMPRLNLFPRGKLAFDHRQTGGLVDLFGLDLVHRKGRGQHPGMRIGNAQPFQNALDAAILAPTAMQGVETDVGFDFGQAHGQIGAAIDLDHLISCRPQGIGACAPRDKRNLPLSGKPTHQNCHFGGHPARCARHTLPYPGLM